MRASLYVDTSEKLRALCAGLAGSPWVALDTEFMREKTYFPKFCLLQVATEEVVACIDPLALESLAPLFEILFDPATLKVFHSGRQDMEIIYRLCGRLPRPVFDTQLAAPLLGMGEQISYAGLVAELLGINLSKSHCRTDWLRRPLSPEQIQYAVEDVVYLGKVYLAMAPRLEKLGRLAWLQEDFSALADSSLYENPPELAWQRISGIYQLKGRQLSIAQTLAEWREFTAQALDLPRGWILKDDALFDLARQQPSNAEQLGQIRGIDERVIKRHGAVICKLIGEAANRPPQAFNLKRKPPKRTVEQEAMIDLLMAVVRLRSEQNTLNSSTLASRRDLEQLLDGEESARLNHGWRKSMVGDELAALLRGELSLKVIGGRLLVQSDG